MNINSSWAAPWHYTINAAAALPDRARQLPSFYMTKAANM